MKLWHKAVTREPHPVWTVPPFLPSQSCNRMIVGNQAAPQIPDVFKLPVQG